MKIVIVGMGYVGASIALLLSKTNEVIGVDLQQSIVDAINARISHIDDIEITEYLASEHLNLTASADLEKSVVGANYVIIATPTNYDEQNNSFDTSSVEKVIAQVFSVNQDVSIIIKSTIPVGFTDYINKKYKTDKIIFSPEFLREGRSLYDNLYPSRIIVGSLTKKAKDFSNLMASVALKDDVKISLMGAREAEAVKLFSNSYLAMRVAFFNELDTYALASDLNSREIIEGVSLDPRVGMHYNNPSFGYGGYCLPKDTKQLLANYDQIPQNIISAIVDANSTRKDVIAREIMKTKPRVVGVYRLIMKAGSDNFRDSAILGIIERLQQHDVKMVIYEPGLDNEIFPDLEIQKDLKLFKCQVDVIIANRMTEDLYDVRSKTFSRDLFQVDV